MSLASEHPHEYPRGTAPLPDEEVAALATETPEWSVAEGRLSRTLKFRNFNESFGFVTRVALLAEAEGHHPDIFVSWNTVRLDFWTHTAGGLTRNDFIMAARVDRLVPEHWS